jgi:pimeloyl-ACP methyl ester carboxylesterase
MRVDLYDRTRTYTWNGETMMSTPHDLMVLKLAVVLLVFTIGCGDGLQSVTEETRAPPQGLVAGEHVWTTPDGIDMPYEVAGKTDAEVTVVFVHCWMCDRTFWDAQLPVLAERYRTVTLDLPGHGEAGSDRAEWTVGAYGDDVAGLVESLDLSRVVLVGHSMGGPVSLRAAALLSGRVLGIVAVDTLHDAEFEFDDEGVRAFMQAFEEDFVGTCESFVDRMFPEEGVDDIVARVHRRSCDANRGEVGIALMRDYAEIDFLQWFREAGVPVRAINAAAPNQTKIEINQKYADFDAVLMEGVGHYPHMTRPDEFNELMLEAIAGLVGS